MLWSDFFHKITDFCSGIVLKFKYFRTVFRSNPVLLDISVMFKPCACRSLIINNSSVSIIVSNPGIFTQDCQLGIFNPEKMGKSRPLLTESNPRYIELGGKIKSYTESVH